MQSLHNVPAPAKLNLFLHITGRRDDGYHLLQSTFMMIDWWDVLHFDRRDDGQLLRQDLSTPLPEHDLSLKAAYALQQASGSRYGALIRVQKNLPSEAGLGGGSSDAASTLLALNRLWNLNWPLSRLLTLGATLGADVPFFLGGRNAWVQGIGEQLQAIYLPQAHFVVLKPQQGLSTATIFQDPLLIRNTQPATIQDFAAQPYAFGRNDLQAVAEKLCPQVSQAIRWLENQSLQARMTGSGSAVFAKIEPSTVLAHPPEGWTWRICSNLDAHPLHRWVSCDD
jgi:4-diphosphocytidyl-2-C-methyl-D-erythritol kinase